MRRPHDNEAFEAEREGRIAYLVAALLGLAFAAWALPFDFVFPSLAQSRPFPDDTGQHIAAQRWFIAEPWSWPPLAIRSLGAPDGTNLAFVDGIPILAVPLKLIAAWLPAGFHGIGLWYALSAILQPVAAVWCLRAAGERRLLPALAIALLALGMPAWIARFGHTALWGHFIVLLGLGCALRLVRRPTRAGWIGAILLQPAALFVHPYLAGMTLAMLASVPLTLLLRGDPRWRGAALATSLAIAAVLLPTIAFGYLGAQGEGGYGAMALNLASPLWPHGSWLLGTLAPGFIDATGNTGWDGYNWLGLGVVASLLFAAILSPRALFRLPLRHPGLVLALLALTVFAVSHRVGFAGRILLDLGDPPGLVQQFRGSARFFWPVGYALAIGAAIVLLRASNLGAPLLLLAGLLQFADAQPIRAAFRDWAEERPAWPFDADALRPLLRAHARLTLLPTWFCAPATADGHEARARIRDLLLLASERPLPVNTMYVARWHGPIACADEAVAARPLAPGELRLIMPDSRERDLHRVPDGDRLCREVGEVTACSLAFPAR